MRRILLRLKRFSVRSVPCGNKISPFNNKQAKPLYLFGLQIEERKQHQARLLDQLNSIQVPGASSSASPATVVSA